MKLVVRDTNKIMVIENETQSIRDMIVTAVPIALCLAPNIQSW